MSQPTNNAGSVEGETNKDVDDDGVSRRRLLASGAATWASVSVAGCPGDGGDGGTATQTETGTPTETATPEPQPENFVVTAETWAGSEGVPAAVSFMSACVTSNSFVPGMEAVFFVGVYDPETGEKLTPEELDSVQVSIGDGVGTVSLSWNSEHTHSTQDENNWAGSWTVPSDMEPQEIPYTVEVSGGEGNFRDVGVLKDTIEIFEYDDPANLVVDTETRSSSGPHSLPEYTNGFVGSCAPERQFTSEMDVTFVVGIYDSTNGNLVGSDGLYLESASLPEEENPDSLKVSDEGSPYNNGIESVTIVSPDGKFEDFELEWTDAADDSHGLPRWFGTLDTENLSAGTYAYEVQITDETSGVIDVGLASSSFSIIEVPN